MLLDTVVKLEFREETFMNIKFVNLTLSTAEPKTANKKL